MNRCLWTVSICMACACAGCSNGSSDRVEPDAAGSAAPDDADRTTEPTDARQATVDSLMRFDDVTESSGVDFTYRNGEEAGHFAILESLGGGAALFDGDRDGDLDLFLPGGGEFGANSGILGRAPGYFHNLRGWQFRDDAMSARVNHSPFYSHGAATADFDNDGFTDVLVTGFGGLVLLKNLGDGTYLPVTDEARLMDGLWSTSAAWGDFDGDGHLDLYVAHYVNWSFDNHPFCPGPEPDLREVCPPREFDPLPDYLYLSNGDGTFRESSATAGLVTSGPNAGKGLGVFAADIDADRDVDIYVGNDTVANFLYRNRGDGTFDDLSLMSGTSLNDKGVPDGSMGVDLGDVNLDGLPDIWVANYERESFGLYRNEGDCFFRPVSQAMGVTAVGGMYVGWGTVFADFDLDADEDIFASNGHVIRYPTSAPLRQNPLLFQNESGRRLVNVAPTTGSYLQTPHMGRGVAAGDVDNDGDIDLVVVHTNERASLLENRQTSGHHLIEFCLIGTHSNRASIGATVQIESAGRMQIRHVRGGGSYASSHDTRVLFGLSGATEVDGVTISWPSGATQNLPKCAADTSWIVIEGRGTFIRAPRRAVVRRGEGRISSGVSTES